MNTVRHHATLFYYDGPQVFEGRDAIGGHYVGLLVDSGSSANRYLLAGVAPERLREFRLGSLDLRALLMSNPDSPWFLANGDADLAQPLKLESQSSPWADCPYLPDAGFVLHDAPASSASLQEARARNNLVLELAVEPPEAATEHRIRARTLAGLLTHTQILLKHAYGAALRELSIDNRKSLDRTDAHLMDVIIPAAPGSFRVVLEAAKGPDMLGQNELAVAVLFEGIQRFDHRGRTFRQHFQSVGYRHQSKESPRALGGGLRAVAQVSGRKSQRAALFMGRAVLCRRTPPCSGCTADTLGGPTGTRTKRAAQPSGARPGSASSSGARATPATPALTPAPAPHNCPPSFAGSKFSHAIARPRARAGSARGASISHRFRPRLVMSVRDSVSTRAAKAKKRDARSIASRSVAPESVPMATIVTRKKPSFPIGPDLLGYLRRYKRERDLSVTYERLRSFREGIALTDEKGRPTLWETVIYDSTEMRELNDALKQVYALLKVDGDLSVMKHLYVDRIDFCTFGNSTPFRIRIVNAYNDNQDYFYVKKADSSRIYGLELEHLLSPNRINYITHGSTLIEEHIIGLPGDAFIERWLNRPDLRPIRIAKELVKFNERCFIRLLGDMRSYNFVVLLTPDFDDWQVRIRAMDFDQQSYNGRKNFYLPQFFPENTPLALFCTKHIRPETAHQYVREEHTLMLQRAGLAAERLSLLLHDMARDPIAPIEKVRELRASLAEHFGRDAYLRCESMGALIRENLESIRRSVGRPIVAELVPE